MATPIRIAVESHRPLGPWRPIWNWFGYDEPNYTDQPHGRALLADLAALHAGPVYVRTHNLLTSGDGTPALKWGSTGVYGEDAAGTPVYSWTIMDRIFDSLVEAGVTPFIQAGFMPEALTTGPPPYRHDFPNGGITTGWAWPPKDYGRWGELIEAWARHLRDRYGWERVTTWPWEIWNEPDGLYWKGTIPDFCRLHDIADAAIRRAIPEARVGGPHTCGPLDPQAAGFLEAFLDPRRLRHQPRQRHLRHAPRLHRLPRQGQADPRRRTRAHGDRRPARLDRRRARHRPPLPGVRRPARHPRRIRSGRLRRLLDRDTPCSTPIVTARSTAPR